MENEPVAQKASKVINLADRLEHRLMAAEREMPLPSLHHQTYGLTLSECLHHTFKNLMAMADASRRGRASPALTGVALWRIAEGLRDSAFDAERLERKLRKAKKKAKR